MDLLKFYLNGVLIFIFMNYSKGQHLPEGSANRVTECEGTILRGSCPTNHVIAVKDVQYGTTDCALSANDPGCCDYDPTDCLTDYRGTSQQAACSGRGVCNEVTIGEEDTSSCGAPYPDLNHYLTMEYYCIPNSRIGKMCDSVSLTVTGSPLYTWNNDYPSGPIRTVTTSCSCSVETSSCNSQINVYFVHFELDDGAGSCSDNQNVQIDDKGSIQTYTCSQNNNFEITAKMTSSSNYITVNLNNPVGVSDGKFWIGFEATDNNFPLEVACPAKEQTICKDCSPLSDPADGSVTYSNGMIYQSVATFKCRTGFSLVGDITRTCQEDATWNNTNPTCEINDCGPLSEPDDGSVSYSSGTIYQSVATFKCRTGYSLVGDTTRTCQEDAKWSNTYPLCDIKDCGPLSDPGDGLITYSNGTTYQSVATFGCRTGFSLVGDITRICQEDATWSYTNPTCEIKDCGSVGDPADGSVTYSNGTTYQSVATFECRIGYSLVGDTTRTCQEDATWSSTNPACQINDCGPLSDPDEGLITNSNGTTYQSVATFGCGIGFSLVGDITRICQEDATWSNTNPTCKINDCGSLSDPADGSVTYLNGTTYKSVATFACRTGYSLVGDTTRTCQEDATWSTTNPACEINGLGDSCTISSHCSAVADSSCKNNICVCADGYIGSNNACTAVSNGGLGDSCTIPSDCTAVAYAACNNNVCSCVAGYIDINNACTAASSGGLGDSCTIPSDCSAVADATCNNNLCTCSNGYTQSNNACTTVSTRELGDGCTVPSHCSAVADATCKNHVCTCVDGYTQSNNECTATSSKGQGGGLSIDEIVGIVVGIALFVILVCLITFCIWKRVQSFQKDEKQSLEDGASTTKSEDNASSLMIGSPDTDVLFTAQAKDQMLDKSVYGKTVDQGRPPLDTAFRPPHFTHCDLTHIHKPERATPNLIYQDDSGYHSFTDTEFRPPRLTPCSLSNIHIPEPASPCHIYQDNSAYDGFEESLTPVETS